MTPLPTCPKHPKVLSLTRVPPAPVIPLRPSHAILCSLHPSAWLCTSAYLAPFFFAALNVFTAGSVFMAQVAPATTMMCDMWGDTCTFSQQMSEHRKGLSRHPELPGNDYSNRSLYESLKKLKMNPSWPSMCQARDCTSSNMSDNFPCLSLGNIWKKLYVPFHYFVSSFSHEWS